jgi:DNA polymerase elongation subunit (family B)
MVDVRVVKVGFTPTIGDYFNTRQPEDLKVHIYGCTSKGKHVHLELIDTEPRFWVKCDENPMEYFGRTSRVKRIEHNESTTLNGEPLWTVYVNHPADVYVLRKRVPDMTLQDKVYYDDAVRSYYGIDSFINVSQKVLDGEVPFTPDLIKPAKKTFNKARDFMFDIETGDRGGFPNRDNPTQPVRCLTFQDMNSGKHYCAIATDVDVDKVKSMLSDSKWLRENCNVNDEFDGVIPPIDPDNLIIEQFDYTMIEDEEFAEQEAERWLYHWFLHILKTLKPNRILGHNVFEFDIDYMVKRGRRVTKNIEEWNKKHQGLKLPRKVLPEIDQDMIPCTQVYDTMHGYTGMIEGSAKVRGRAALDWMCRNELGYGKINRKPHLIDELFVDDPAFLLAYNIWDCEAATRAVKKTDMLEFHASLCDYNGTGLDNLGSPKKLIMSSLRKRLKCKEILPNLAKTNEGIEGGFVADAPILLEEKMFELDLSKEYPSVIMTLNMGFKTHVKDLREIIDMNCDEPLATVNDFKKTFPDSEFKPTRPVSIAPSGNCYLADVVGIVPEVLKEMAKERDVIRKKMFGEVKGSDEWRLLNGQQIARKISMNSWYGILAQVAPAIGADITDIARRHIRWIRDKCNASTLLFNPETKHAAVGFGNVKARDGYMRLIFEVVYTDTDSAKCKIANRIDEETRLNYSLAEEDILKIGACLSEKLNKSFSEFAIEVTGGYTDKHSFDVKVEEAYKAYMQTGAKKRYAYLSFDDKVSTRGYDTRRSDSTELTRMALNQMFGTVLRNPETGVEEFGLWLAGFEDRIRSGEYDKYCGKPIGLNSANERTQHYKAAMASNKDLGKSFKVGDKVFLWWVKNSDTKIYALEYEETPDAYGLETDYDTIIQKFVRHKIDLVLKPLTDKSIGNFVEKIHLTQDGDVEELF